MHVQCVFCWTTWLHQIVDVVGFTNHEMLFKGYGLTKCLTIANDRQCGYTQNKTTCHFEIQDAVALPKTFYK